MRVACGLVVLAIAGCLPSVSTPVTNVIDLRYRQTTAEHSAIQIYRWFGARTGSVGSRCKMLPTDSQMFAVRASRCGGLAAWYWGVARVLLEESASSRFMQPLRVDGKRRWVDLPGTSCER